MLCNGTNKCLKENLAHALKFYTDLQHIRQLCGWLHSRGLERKLMILRNITYLWPIYHAEFWNKNDNDKIA